MQRVKAMQLKRLIPSHSCLLFTELENADKKISVA